MIRCMQFTRGKTLRTDIVPSEIHTILQDPNSVLWVDLDCNPVEVDEPLLRETFEFHPLVIEDALQETHVPRLDEWNHYIYIVLHAVGFDHQDPGNLGIYELDIFLGQNYMVTHHDQPIKAVERVWNYIQRDTSYMSNGADHLLYRLIDQVVDNYMPVVEEIDDAIDLAEDEIFTVPTSDTLEKIFDLKRTALQLRRILLPEREVVNKLARDEFSVVNNQTRIYFRDVYDHLVRMHDITESIRDLVTGALDTYLSVVNNRMNDIMRTLTVITTMFMPISFVASFFGMNYFQSGTPLAIWVSPFSFAISLTITILSPILMYLWMRRRKWLE